MSNSLSKSIIALKMVLLKTKFDVQREKIVISFPILCQYC